MGVDCRDLIRGSSDDQDLALRGFGFSVFGFIILFLPRQQLVGEPWLNPKSLPTRSPSSPAGLLASDVQHVVSQ